MSALAGMITTPQWICYRLVPQANGKLNKIPTDPRTGIAVDPLASTTWMPHDIATQWAQYSGLGIGFTFTENDPYFFIDLDSCLGADGQWQRHALEVLARFPGAAVEVSVSGKGLHIFGKYASVPPHSNKCPPLRSELYTRDRFVALGHSATGDADTDHTQALHWFAAQHFPPRESLSGVWTTEPRSDYTGTFGDDELIRRALRSQSAASAFGTTASFEDLWRANEDALSEAFPDPQRAYDANRADAALASRLSFWTGANCERIRELMLQSGLQRSKWHERDDYLVRTIMFAVSGTPNVFSKEEPAVPDFDVSSTVTVEGAPGVTVVDGYPYCGPEELFERFKDYVWVENIDRIVGPDGALLNENQFRKRMRARVYALDHVGKNTTTDAHKAFHHSQCFDFIHAHALSFEPGNHETLVMREGKLCANSWRDPEPVMKEGDPSPFVNHIHKLLPHGNDAQILLAFMAALVQYQGKKFAWCPLVQGVQGCGKTTLAAVLEHAVGQEYVHVLKGAALTQQFNGWLSKSIVAVVEDLQISKDRSWAMESIKPMITSRRLQIERKGIDQVTESICCNFILTSNHQDAIPLDRNERRFAVFFCAQQSEDDLERDGLTEAYFNKLYDWLENQDGYEIVSHYLATTEIPAQYNPAGQCVRAPKTTSHEDAIDASRPLEAQLILEAVAADEPGFRGGWISTIRAAQLLESKRVNTGPRRLMKILEGLGYVRHPRLNNGRTSKPVMQEGGRPRLYVLRGHLSGNFEHMDVTDAYEKAQGYESLASATELTFPKV